MIFDPRENSFEWAWAKGWKVELAGTTITIRDGEDYVMTEMDLSHVRPSSLRLAVADLELQKSAIHVAVRFCGLTEKAARWKRSAHRT